MYIEFDCILLLAIVFYRIWPTRQSSWLGGLAGPVKSVLSEN